MAKGEDLLLAYRVQDFTQIVKEAKPLEKMELALLLRVLDHIKIIEDGTILIVFLEGTKIVCKSEFFG